MKVPLQTEPPKHLIERYQVLRAKAFDAPLTEAEHTELVMLTRMLDAWIQQQPAHKSRTAYDKDAAKKLRQWEEHADDLRKHAEFLMGLRKDRHRPQNTPYTFKVSK